MMSKIPPIVLAVDTADLELAIEWVKASQGLVCVYKLGLEFFMSCGVEGVRQVANQTDSEIFLDLKLHDIPHTVSGAASAISTLRPKFLTVHASGGAAMVAAAVKALPSTLITGVTVLTSLSESDVDEIGFRGSALESAVGLARLAVEAGAKAVVCSPHEIVAIRECVGPSVVIITPGVRPLTSQDSDDQVRTMTPGEAIGRGADLVVIGRPITQEWSKGASAMRQRTLEIGSQIL